jgi:glycosyltransferase involved in cell wall biosynthesis
VAFAKVTAQVPNAKLLVIGPHEPDKTDALPPHIIDAAKANGVHFLGHRNDVHELYAALDIYVLASWREGFPRSAMEAAACGLPLVCTDIRGCRQVVDNNVTGKLVPRQDAQALAVALIELATRPELRESMAAAAQDKAKSDFDQQQVIDITLDTYRRLLAENTRAAVA